MVGPPEQFLLLFGKVELPEHLIRGLRQTLSQVRVERRADEQLIDAGFRPVGR